MNLSEQQKKAVAAWVAEGASIAEVQKRLRDDFQVSLTYMDTRFLIDDLGLAFKSPEPPKTAAAPSSTSRKTGTDPVDADAELIDEGDDYAAGFDAFADDLPPVADDPGVPGAAKISVEVDRLTRPGTVVSGTVKFSDGQSGKWALDQYGRLVFEGSTPGYRPSQADLQAFQRELSGQLQRHGY